ncbi:hypothetical protein DYB32_009303, partial [Aphanomyces invadans]
RDETKRKIIGAAVDIQDALVIDCPRTVAYDVNGVTALALLDSGANHSVVWPTFLVRVKSVGNFALVMRQLDRPIELGEFIEAMKLTVDHDVKLRLTFDTAEGTLVRDVKARLGYCFHLLLARAQSVFDLNQLGGKETPLIAATKVVKTMDKTKSSPDEALLYPEEERACFPDVQSG